MAEETRITAAGLADRIGRSVQTIKIWYDWYCLPEYAEDRAQYNDIPELPMYVREGSPTRGTRYWTVDQVEQVKKFRDWIIPGRKGQLGRINAKLWNAGRGERALANKAAKELLEKNQEN